MKVYNLFLTRNGWHFFFFFVFLQTLQKIHKDIIQVSCEFQKDDVCVQALFSGEKSNCFKHKKRMKKIDRIKTTCSDRKKNSFQKKFEGIFIFVS